MFSFSWLASNFIFTAVKFQFSINVVRRDVLSFYRASFSLAVDTFGFCCCLVYDMTVKHALYVHFDFGLCISINRIHTIFFLPE